MPDRRPPKKLIEAARRCVNGTPNRTEQAEALAAFNISVDLAEFQDEVLPIWPDNWMPLQIFNAMGTQWNCGAMGGFLGLRYEVLPWLFRVHGVPASDRSDVMAALRVMEREALNLLNAG